MRVLIIEDDERLARSIQQLLNEQDIPSDISFDGEEGLEYARVGEYDVIVLDVMLPGINGFEIVKRLRSENINTPTLILSAKDAIDDKVFGLNQGADDYMSKPFNTTELIARIRALTRRKNEILPEEIQVGDLTLNQNPHYLFCGNKRLQLGAKEYQICEILMMNPKQLFSKETLINKIWGLDSDAEENNVEAYISFIRKKLNFLNTNVSIKTVRKSGYHLEVNKD
ncbi:MAG: response regulator transcription factor [Erysipelothrix sp.]|nr:response regulator transcription factor [Erysipelothrix sp.]